MAQKVSKEHMHGVQGVSLQIAGDYQSANMYIA